jgi:hypothetical protein
VEHQRSYDTQLEKVSDSVAALAGSLADLRVAVEKRSENVDGRFQLLQLTVENMARAAAAHCKLEEEEWGRIHGKADEHEDRITGLERVNMDAAVRKEERDKRNRRSQWIIGLAAPAVAGVFVGIVVAMAKHFLGW